MELGKGELQISQQGLDEGLKSQRYLEDNQICSFGLEIKVRFSNHLKNYTRNSISS